MATDLTNFDNFFKVLKRFGYPNPNIKSLAAMSTYDINNFLFDMNKKIGLEKTNEFVDVAIAKFLNNNKTLRVDISNLAYGPSYVIFKIINFEPYDPSVISNGVIVNWKIIKSAIVDENQKTVTLNGLRDKTDIRDMDTFYEFERAITIKAEDYTSNNLGFFLIFE